MVDNSLPVTLSNLVASAVFTSVVFAFKFKVDVTSAEFAFKLSAVFTSEVLALSASAEFVASALKS